MNELSALQVVARRDRRHVDRLLPQCFPSRARLITGRYQTRFGVEEIAVCPLPVEEVTVAERSKSAGYQRMKRWKDRISDEPEVARQLRERLRQRESELVEPSPRGGLNEEELRTVQERIKVNHDRPREQSHRHALAPTCES